MALRGTWKNYIADLLTDRDDIPVHEGVECFVLEAPSTLYKYSGGAWQAIGGYSVVVDVSGKQDALPDITGNALKVLRVNAAANGYEYATMAGGGDMVGANNLSELTDINDAKTVLELEEVDNTSDADKPISDATQTALDDKVDKVAGQGLSANDYNNTDKAKVDFISVSQAVDLDAMETRINALDAAVVLKGTWDASAGTFPGGGTAQAGDSYIVTVDGTVGGTAFKAGDRVIAITDNASTTIFAANWFKADYTDQVLSVNSQTGAVTLTTADVADSSNKRYCTDAEKTVIGNTSGTNSGNETTTTVGALVNGATEKVTPVDADFFGLMDSAASNVLKKFSWANMKVKLQAFFDSVYQAILVSGTNIKTVNGVSILGSGNLIANIVSQTAANTTIPSGYAMSVPDYFEIPDGVLFQIDDGGYLEII